MTFRQKTIIGVAVIEALLLLLLIWTGIHYLRTTNQSELIKRSSATLTLLARASRDAVLTTDIATLEDIVSSAIVTPGLRYVRILDADGLVLAQAGARLPATGRVEQDLDYTSVDDGSFDSGVDIRESNTRYGRVEIGLSTAHIEEMVSDARRKAAAIAMLEMVLVALFSLALGTYLTRQLSSLSKASRRISEGKLGYQLPVKGTDELATTARAFNQMSLRLQEDIELEKSIIQSALDCIIAMDQQGRITEFNPMAEKTFGYSRKDVIGRPLAEAIIPPAQREAHHVGLKHFLATGESPIIGKHVQLSAMRSDGTEFPVEMAVNVTRLQEKPLFTAYLRDITDRSEYERTLKQAKKDAEQATHAKSIFLANMSHEIRTPLNAVLGLLGLLSEEDNLTSQQQAWIKTAQSAGGVLLNLINDTLDFSKLDAGKLDLETSSFSLKTLLDTTLDMLRPKAESKGIKLSSELAATLPTCIQADGERLRQILVNLIGNAIKFTDTGEIRLQISPTAANDTGFVRFSVYDTGIGIRSADQEKLFTEFTQLSRDGVISPDGTGLGLAICRQLVELMGGKIGVESEPGQGSCFWFEIPLIEGDENPEIAAQRDTDGAAVRPVTGANGRRSPVCTAGGPGRRILLAEDSPANQMVALAMLEDTGYHIDTVANGLEAVESVRNLPYDLVLMDISMPEMNGMEATAAIRKLSGDKANIPIIAMTAHAIKGDQEKFLAAGMDDYISKPVDKQLLLKVLDKWMPKIAAAAAAGDSTEASGPQVSQVLDNDTLAQLAQDTSPQMLPRMLEAFRKEAIGRVQAISQQHSPPELEQLGREAHSLKSSAGTFGAFDLQQLALELELACRNGQAAVAEQAARKIQHEWDRVRVALDQYLADASTAKTAAN